MDLDPLRTYLLQNHAMLEQWGSFVEAAVVELVKTSGLSLQLSSHRVKSVESACLKAEIKGYRDPVVQMEDLVGVRIAVLVSPEVGTVGKLIESSDKWAYTLSKDTAADARDAPDRFGYQSRHYILRPKASFVSNGLTIESGIPCEIQVRTLLQHAYAELVHDSIYKASGPIPHQASRFAASSVALIETTDHLFCETMRLLKDDNAIRNQLLEQLSALRRSQVGDRQVVDSKLNLFVLETYRERLAEKGAYEDIESLLQKSPFIAENIRSREDSDTFWGQPIALLAYWVVATNPRKAFDEWPLASSHEALEQIYSDLGLAHLNS
jgi:putative GTP pyrophosphokinase